MHSLTWIFVQLWVWHIIGLITLSPNMVRFGKHEPKSDEMMIHHPNQPNWHPPNGQGLCRWGPDETWQVSGLVPLLVVCWSPVYPLYNQTKHRLIIFLCLDAHLVRGFLASHVVPQRPKISVRVCVCVRARVCSHAGKPSQSEVCEKLKLTSDVLRNELKQGHKTPDILDSIKPSTCGVWTWLV